MAVLLVFAKKVLISLALLFFLNFLFPTFATVDCFLVNPSAVSPYCSLSLSVLLCKKDPSVAGSINYRCTTFKYIVSARLPKIFSNNRNLAQLNENQKLFPFSRILEYVKLNILLFFKKIRISLLTFRA